MSGKLTSLLASQDMTQGSPSGNLIRFSVPLLIGNLAQQLYSTVDSIVVGYYVGDNALAAVGASGPIMNLLLVLFMGISVGASVMVSQYFGHHLDCHGCLLHLHHDCGAPYHPAGDERPEHPAGDL